MAFKMKGFKAHNMYKTEKAETYKEHLALEKKGYDHSPYKKKGCTCYEDYSRVPNTKPCAPGSCKENSPMKKKDACYHKVKARYTRNGGTWPSAYGSGALAKCRKVGVSNWGNKSKKK